MSCKHSYWPAYTDHVYQLISVLFFVGSEEARDSSVGKAQISSSEGHEFDAHCDRGQYNMTPETEVIVSPLVARVTRRSASIIADWTLRTLNLFSYNDNFINLL